MFYPEPSLQTFTEKELMFPLHVMTNVTSDT